MAFNYSVTAFIKSPWTQFDFTHFLKEALTSMFVSQPKGLQAKKKKTSSDSAGEQLNMVFQRKYLQTCGLEATLMMKKCEKVKYCISGVPLRRESSSPKTATYCLKLVLRAKLKEHTKK